MRIVFCFAMLGAFVRALVRAPARRVARAVSHLNAASAGGLRLRDAATKEVVDTAAGHGASRDDGVLKWYACGPTVYDATHLGHARTYVTLDLVRRAATAYGGSRVDFAMGVTDVDDKIINRARELGLEPLELARREEANFFEDLDRLGCLRPDRVLRVSEHVDDIVAYVGDIVDRGFGYATEGGDVWFDVGKLGDAYGAFAEGRGTSKAAAQAALEAEDKASISTKKRDGRDFALWKGAKAGEISWDSPWGAGRPGWHIECSAMTRATFGDALDLHAGGVDLAFPHHENEIAQWRGASGDLEGVWCPCWLHTGHLHIEGRKMSKSLKNFVTVRELLDGDDAVDPEDFRLFCAMHRYDATINFSRAKLDEAAAVRAQLAAGADGAAGARGEGVPGRMPPAAKRWGAGEAALEDARRACERDVAAASSAADLPAGRCRLAREARDPNAPVRARRARGTRPSSPSPARRRGLPRGDAGGAGPAGASARRRASVGAAAGAEAPAAGDAGLDALLAFRADVRTLALDARDDESRDKLRGRVLGACDAVRDADVFVDRGVALVDLPDGSPTLEPRLAAAPADATPKPKPPPPQKADLSDVPPAELFRSGEYAAMYASYDDDGLPLTDADGAPLSKSQTKKLKKKRDVHAKKWSGAAKVEA
ncbi:cysteinyl tRNA synthetase [Aureococcus anophagefferens]|uniref:cysteine--tRNA ligase n=2 Tax=Aureococcus anophagefferens TaxID=44056 RepID=A0ABR1FP23_AURAN